MKRSISLVDYASSDESDTNSAKEANDAPESGSQATQSASKKLKKLPPLPGYLAPQAPVDNPALHQGRRRTTPHVEGQFAAYVYIPLFVERQSKLYRLLLRIFQAARKLVPILHPIGISQADLAPHTRELSPPEQDPFELHISLTRPVYLRAHQRADFKRAVHDAAKAKRRFSASFATISDLTNDEKTRTFLALEVGAGHDDFKELSERLTPTLRSIRQKEFYQDPRFHASIAWALLDGTARAVSQQVQGPEQGRDRPSTTERLEDFPTIPGFPPSLIPQLRAEFSQQVVDPSVGRFEAEEVHVRIGKEISKWRLQD
ncbi:hypothetical protein PYCCODRAFT_1390116 [Trametes coccinea BRFM310]|uniref:U6 snRNA phosphodiesterase 1 n=1 Tax=Trametes coccinea (strain BRFM310) TaxID=1353009 RepID=A0A1Y2IMT5_TRAC3|nr:hypothetical protein PYCCODRAFT_1390116 [Trametes coccinea BRFM310]